MPTGPAGAAIALIPRRWDVAIVGAGPAGAAAAIRVASAGVRALLVDRAIFPRGKVCGCCVSPRGLAELSQLGVDVVASSTCERIESVQVLARGRSAILPMLPGGLAISREELDTALVQEAGRRGVCVLEGVGATLASDGPAGASIALRRGEESVSIVARVAIVADGLGGTFLPREGVWSPVISRGSRIGLGARLSARAGPAHAMRAIDGLPPGTVRMFCASGGYVGAVRLGDGSIDLAAAVTPELVRASLGPAGAVEAIMFAASGLPVSNVGARRHGADEMVDVRWFGTPRLTRRRVVEQGSIIVAGDAAGYVEPFTGEGISWALRGGIAAADHAVEMLSDRAARPRWRERHRSLFAGEYRRCGLAALCLRSPRLVSGVGALLTASPRLRLKLVGILARNWGQRAGLGGA